jgi:membrane protein DedA with SNARE-associated domain
MPVSGLAAARGKMDIAGVIASGTAGAMLGNYFWYLAARVVGIERFRPFIQRWGKYLTLDWAEIEKAEKLFGTQGWAIVFFGRMLPTLRSLISIPAGLLHMRLSTFVIWSTIGTAGWTTLLGLSGYVLGRRFQEVDTYVGPISTAVVAAIIIGYVWRLMTWKPADHGKP